MEEKKIYTEKAINIATYFGGPLIAGYLLSENFKIFKEEDNSKRTLIGSIIFLVIFFEIIFSIPESILNEIPNMLFPLIYSAIAYLVFYVFQKKKSSKFLNEGGLKHSGWRVFGISVIGLVITLGYVFLRASFIVPFDGEVMEFGENKDQIYYNESTNRIDVEKVAKTLQDFGYFNSAEQQAVNLISDNDKYFLEIYVIKEWWDDKDIIASMHYLEHSLNTIDLSKSLKIKMYDESLEGRIYKILPGVN